jgi:hypothetical protein
MKTLTQKFAIGLGVAAAVGLAAGNVQAQEGTWTVSSVQLAIARKLQGVTTVGNQISVLGGRNGAAASGDVEVLTVTGGRVTAAQTRADLPGELRDGGRSAACNGRVLLSGGDENSNRSRRANETLLQSLDANPRAISFLVNPIQRFPRRGIRRQHGLRDQR